MKIKAINRCSLPSLGIKFEAGEVRDLIPEQAKSLLSNSNFVDVDGEATGDRKGSYKHRQMTSRRKRL